MAAEHDDFYKRLRKKVHKWARSKEGKGKEYTEYILLAPDLFHLLVKLSLDKDVAVREKAKLGGAIAYFLSPVDLLPEWLVGPIGYLDDVGLAVFVLHSVLQNTDESVVTRHWAGEKDLLETIRTFMGKADRMLGSGLWGRLKAVVEPGGAKRTTVDTKATKTSKARPARSDAARGTELTTGPTEVAGRPKATTRTATKKTVKKAATKKVAKKTGTKEGGNEKGEPER